MRFDCGEEESEEGGELDIRSLCSTAAAENEVSMVGVGNDEAPRKSELEEGCDRRRPDD